MVENRIIFALIVEAVHVDNVLRELPVIEENRIVEVISVEADKEEVNTNNPCMEEAVIWFAFNDDVVKDDKVTLLTVIEDR